MVLADAGGAAPYFGVFVAAILEGEVLFVLAATLVSQGRLDPVWVAVAGAAGAACGDQFYFYALRGRLHRWVERFPRIANRGHALVRRVRQRESLLVFALRFSPGLRIALSAACAYANVPPWKFSVLNGLAAVIWAVGLLFLIAWAGPRWLPGFGISGWWSAVVPAAILIVVFRAVSGAEERVLEE